MKRIIFISLISLLAFISSWGQTVAGKQAHAMLNSIVIGNKDALDKAQVTITDQVSLANGISIKLIECSSSDKKTIDTYVASYNENGAIIDGMLVGTKGDISVLRSQRDNEYIWFVPKGEANCSITADSINVIRKFNYEMKPIGLTHMRHCITIISRYTIMPDGTFKQSEPLCEATQIEYQIDENGHELPPTSKMKVSADYNDLSLKVMQLLYAPISVSDKTMDEWGELGLFFESRAHMTGVPDADVWSANYYKQNIHRILLQGDGHNMDWFYRHHDAEETINMWLIMLAGYEYRNGASALVGEIPSWATKQFKDTAKRLKDKKAKQWWKDFLK